MARIRSIKPEFWTSEQIVECSTEARLLFIGIWNFADDGGIIPHSDKSLKMKIFPADEYLSTDVRRMLDELSTNNLIQFFSAEDARYIRVRGWKHQKIDRPSFKFPQPCGQIPRDKNDFLEMCSTNDRRAPPPGVEGKGEELGRGEFKNINPHNASSRESGEFARFGVGRFKPIQSDVDYCCSLELSEPFAIIKAGFIVYHEDHQSVYTAERWSELFRGWVEKNIIPQVSGE
ncbi:hypothetical protein N9J88_03230 [Porticoccaceae bacterium]|nr:hypothetical protein [Porticoccaceae bacterium]